jgi:GTP-binding protein LepA
LTDAKTYYEYNYRFWRCKTNGFAGIYPVDTEDYEELRNSMEKTQLNDASLVFYRKVRQH